jgi:hypothetical protein
VFIVHGISCGDIIIELLLSVICLIFYVASSNIAEAKGDVLI